ncbi:probable RNA polymerase II nuclear localization protein SLC7A6OS [Diadema setosum]|uniref:probable RNA polymerase II nuclear localization protein SLC7A6OS n=1 Tax=Diadema setosum TaxID=31175 RepID=UPI003B3A4C3E
MATILRVRRKRSCEPSEALIFSCKKARMGDGGSGGKGSQGAAGASGGSAAGSSGEVKTVFKFAGTVAKKDQPISQRIQAALSTVHLYANLEPAKPKPKPSASSESSSSSSKKSKKSKSKSKSKSSSKSKSRASQLASQKEGRFEIVSSHRGLNLSGLDGQSEPSSVRNGSSHSNGAEAKDLFSLFDVVMDESKASSSYKRQSSKSDAITCNSVQMIREKLVIDDSADNEYVYDLYYADDNQLDFGQTVVTGMQLEDEELVHDFFEEDSHEVYDDEDDSNDENNWRNDYPDEDPDKRHADLFDEYHDEYRYGDMSSDDDDLLNDYGDYRKRPTKNLDYLSGGRDPLDDLM